MIGTILNLGIILNSSVLAGTSNEQDIIKKGESTGKKGKGTEEKEDSRGYWNQKSELPDFRGLKNGSTLYCPGVRDADIGGELRHCVVYYAYGNADLTQKVKQFSTVASLVFPLPEGLMDEVGTEWSTDDSRQIRMRQLLGSIVQEGFVGGTKEIIDRSKDNISNFVSNITGRAGTFRDKGKIKNTHQEMYFKGINFRQFSFKHKIMPTSNQETKEARDIVDTFKYLASPGYDNNKSYFTYPSQWEVHFLFNNGRLMETNQHLTSIGRCVLDKVGVNYSSEGVYQSFDGGQPTSIELELSFKEIDLVTKESLKNKKRHGRFDYVGDDGIRGG